MRLHINSIEGKIYSNITPEEASYSVRNNKLVVVNNKLAIQRTLLEWLTIRIA